MKLGILTTSLATNFFYRAEEVRLFVNGHDLIDIVREIELPFTAMDGEEASAASYAGLPPEIAFLPSRHLLGEPPYALFANDDRICLLTCGYCGEPGCWALEARITVSADEVVWQDFANNSRGIEDHWCYDGLGPFVFDKFQYLRALSGSRVL